MITDAAVIGILLIFVFRGSKKGLVKMLFSLLSMAISIVAGFLLYRPISAFLEKMEISKGLAEKLEAGGALDRLPGIMTDTAMPEVTHELYSTAANAAVSAVGFLGVLIIVRLVLLLISAILGAASDLPVIHQANGFAGGIAGFCLGLTVILVLLAAVGVFEAFGGVNITEPLLKGSNITRLIYNNNPLLGMLAK